MTRRSRRASSDPQRVGSEEGLTSSRPASRVEDDEAAESVPDEEAAEPVPDEATEVRGRHTGRKVDQTKDDTDEGWGEAGDDDASARWLRENRPPHWD